MQINWIKISSFVGLFGIISPAFGETNYYRYKDSEGHQVITSTLPSEVTEQGYEVISPRGNVIQTVEPAKTKDELAADQKALEAKRQSDLKQEADKKQQAIQAKKDDILLKSFSSEEDIIRSRDEKIASIEVLEQITNENISRLNKQLKEANNSKTNYEKSGQAIPDTLKKTIIDSERQIKENEAFLARKKVEKESIHTKYQGLINRFHEIEQHDQPQAPAPQKQ